MLTGLKFMAIDPFINALCWTLAHSLWQGLILALVAGLILIGTKRSSAALRYNLLVFCFSLFVAVIGFTFFNQWNGGSGTAGRMISVDLPSIAANDITIIKDPSGISISTTVSTFLNDQSLTIVCIWFLILLIRSARLISGLHSLHQTKTKQIFPAGEFWTARVTALAKEVGIQNTVRFFQSGIAKVPAVLGHFKPIILFPVGLLSSLPPEEVEAILLHELAHIRRKDYLVNLVQHIVEICLFFNPGALWVSSLIKKERENCCDDIAVMTTGSKRNYINALLSFQEFNLGRQPFAPAIAGRKFQLLARVKRLVNDNNKTMNAMEKFSLTAGLLIAGIATLAFTTDITRQKQQKGTQPQVLSGEPVTKDQVLAIPARTFIAGRDTVPDHEDNPIFRKGHLTFNTTKDGKEYRILMVDGKITEFYIDEKKIPDEKINDYKDVTKKILKEAEDNWKRDAEMAKVSRREMQQAREQNERDKKHQLVEDLIAEKIRTEKREVNDREFERATKGSREAEIITEKQRMLIMKEKELQDRNWEVNEKIIRVQKEQIDQQRHEERELQEKLELLQEKNFERTNELKIKHQNLVTLETEKAMNEALQLQREADAAQQSARDLQQKAEISAMKAKQSQVDAERIVKSIIGDLLEANLVDNKNNLSFQLTDEELIVNGKKQPDAIHKKFKEKYIKEKGGSFKYKSGL